VPNSFVGAYVIDGASNNLIEGNVFSGNVSEGLRLADSGTTGNILKGNRAGTNAAGTAALPNGFAGITAFQGASGNRIEGNLLSGNASAGLVFGDAGTNGNVARNNRIGPSVSGALSFTNQFNGVRIESGAQASVIGGSEPGAANVIAGNTSSGIVISGAATGGHVVSRNSIHGNGWQGIVLDGGANGGQASPELASATLGVTTHVTGSLNGTANASYDLEFFSSESAFPSAGQHFIGNGNVIANGSGLATIDIVLPARASAGRVITATARGGSGTSEFSNGVTVTTTDSDGDGLPDAYESTIPGLSSANSADAAADFDGDGFSNLEEFLAGTAPRDPASRLFATGQRSGGDFTVTFPSILGQTYRIDAADSLTGPWVPEVIHLYGNGGMISVTLLATGPRRFFRVITGL
jgi:parallel beta-helix repeat protein